MKNKVDFLYYITSIISISLMITFYALVVFLFDLPYSYKFIISFLIFFIFIIEFIILYSTYKTIKWKKQNIKSSFDHYIEEQISLSGTGVIVFNDDNEIIWVSDFIENRFDMNIIGKSINSLSNDFNKKFEDGYTSFNFSNGGFVFETFINLNKKTIVLRDATNEDKILRQYTSEKLVIGEIEIDNFQQFLVSISEEEIFSAQSKVIKTLDLLSDQWNFIYKQYVNGKYIFFTNEETLTKMIEDKFSFLSEIRKTKIESSQLSVSIGIGSGTVIQKELHELAREGLKQARARGGDQIALMRTNEKPQYFGSKFEIAQGMSRVKIRQIAALFETTVSSKSIKNVLIYGHKFADLDSLGASIGIVEIAKHFKKNAFIVNQTFDSTTSNVINKYLSAEEKNLFIKPTRAQRFPIGSTLMVMVDTSDINRIENERAKDRVKPENIFIFDHHRIVSLPTDVPNSNTYIDVQASSASEIVTEVISFIKTNLTISKNSAQQLLNGIYLDTASFSKSVSSRTFQAASVLESYGAQTSLSVDILKIPEDANKFINIILNNIHEIKPGYFLSYYEGEVPNDVISMAADEVLRTQGRKASFVVARSTDGKNLFKMSARGIETNVQKIAEEVGGGGHFGSAAALSSEPLMVFVDNIRQAIVSHKGE